LGKGLIVILISSHIDRTIQDYKLSYSKGVHTGLLDNFIGVLVSYLALYDDKCLARMEKEGKIQFFHSDCEEWGRTDNFPVLTKSDKIVVVDVASGEQFKGLDFSLENISGFTPAKVKELRESLVWEGFKLRTKTYNGNPDDEDEAWAWKKKGIPVISFIIPIQGDWHSIKQDNTITYEVVKTATQGLKRLLAYLI
jgi:hypothetical protein